MPDAPADTAQQPISSWLFMHVFRAAIVPAVRRASVKLLSTEQARVTICTLHLRNYVATDSYVPSVPAGQEFELRLLQPGDRGYNPDFPDTVLAELGGVAFAFVSRPYGEVAHSTENLVSRLARLQQAGHPIRLRGEALQEMPPDLGLPPPRTRFRLTVAGPCGANNEHLFEVGRACLAAGFALPAGLAPVQDVRLQTLQEILAAARH